MKKILKKSKAIFIIIPIIICIVVIAYILNSNVLTVDFSSKDIIKFDSTVLQTSKEYKDLYELSSLEFYKNNHLLVQENGDFFCDANGFRLNNKFVDSVLYNINDKNELVKVFECFDNNIGTSYTLYQYKNKSYAKYNDANKIYDLYNFCQKDTKRIDKNIPKLDVYKNYNPQFVARYYNSASEDKNAYMEIYELSFIEDEYYKNVLSNYFELDEKGYLKIYINKMKLISAIGVSKSSDEDCVYGPYDYEYYYDKNYNLDEVYNYADSKDLIKVTLVNAENNKTIDTISINKNNILMFEYDYEVEGVYLDKECKNDYKDVMSEEKKGIDRSNINENGDFTLYVKYK